MNRIEYLYKNGDPLLQHAVSSISQNKSKEDPNRYILADFPAVRYWVEKLTESIKKKTFHGSFDSCFENAAFKITQFNIDTWKDTIKVQYLNIRKYS